MAKTGRTVMLGAGDGEAGDVHRHVFAFARKRPSKDRIAIQQADFAFAASLDLIDHVGDGAEADGRAVQHQPRRPFMLAHRLVQERQPLQDRRFPRGVGAGKKGQRAEGQLQPAETLEMTEINSCKHSELP